MGLTWTWGLLMALSVATTGLAGLVSRGGAGRAAVAAILILAAFKAHLIAKTYLGLGRCPRLMHGFDFVLGAVMVLMTALALVAQGGAG